VFLGAVLATVVNIAPFTEFMVRPYCQHIDIFLQDYGVASGLLTADQATCFAVQPFVTTALCVPIAAVMLSSLFNYVVARLCRAALEDREALLKGCHPPYNLDPKFGIPRRHLKLFLCGMYDATLVSLCLIEPVIREKQAVQRLGRRGKSEFMTRDVEVTVSATALPSPTTWASGESSSFTASGDDVRTDSSLSSAGSGVQQEQEQQGESHIDNSFGSSSNKFRECTPSCHKLGGVCCRQAIQEDSEDSFRDGDHTKKSKFRRNESVGKRMSDIGNHSLTAWRKRVAAGFGSKEVIPTLRREASYAGSTGNGGLSGSMSSGNPRFGIAASASARSLYDDELLRQV
jgi:hypothetical protein